MLEQFMNLWPTTQNLTGTKVEGLNKFQSKEFVQRTRHSSKKKKKEGQKDENKSAS